MTNPFDQREFTRVSITFEVRILFEGGRAVSGWTRDVSLRGIEVDVSNTEPTGTRCHVTILLDGPNGSGSVRARGRVVRADGENMGIEFTEIEGLDSWDHLRNLVFYNAPPDGSVEAEFANHLGLKPRETSDYESEEEETG